MSSIDLRQDRQLASNLSSLYSYLFDRLTQANIRDDSNALEEAITILSELRTAWAEAEMALRTGADAAMRLAA
jgi:flagellar protein FliS